MDQAEKLRNIIKKDNQQLRTARVITVTSGKGGVGKSSISVNLAIQLSRLGKRVVILDADFGLANVEVMLGIRPTYTLADLMFKGKSIQDIITVGPGDIGFISGGSGIRELTNLTGDQVRSLVHMLNALDEFADVIIIDTGAGISDIVLELVAFSTEILLVATPEPTSITDAYALMKTLRRREDFIPKDASIKMIGNRTVSEEQGWELYQKLKVVVDKFLGIQLEYLGMIPQDDHIQKAVMKQQPLSLTYPNAPSARAIMELALILENLQETETGKRKGIKEIFANLLKSIKK